MVIRVWRWENYWRHGNKKRLNLAVYWRKGMVFYPSRMSLIWRRFPDRYLAFETGIGIHLICKLLGNFGGYHQPFWITTCDRTAVIQ